MKQKRHPKRKIEEVKHRLRDDAKYLMSMWGIYPDKIAVSSDQWVKVFFDDKNQGVNDRTIQVLLYLEQQGQITFRNLLLWNGPGYDMRFIFCINQTQYIPLSPLQRFRSRIGL